MYDGVACEALATSVRAPWIVAVADCTSTMDLAHHLASEGAAHGTVVVADTQRAGRGRSGKAWHSDRGTGVWVSVLLRHLSSAPVGLLSIRTGLALARRLDAQTRAPVTLKWPNDLLLDGGKLAGILTEARWRGDMMEWLVVGVGVNLTAPPPDASRPTALRVATLSPSARRAAVLTEVVHAISYAATRTGVLTGAECSEYAVRDAVAGRVIRAPLAGTVRGITPDGALVVQTADGERHAIAGSIEFDHPAPER